MFGPASPREGLERMDPETAGVWIERGERRRAADVRDPWSRVDSAGNVPDRGVGHAQQHEIHPIVPERHAALVKPCGHGRSHAAAAEILMLSNIW